MVTDWISREVCRLERKYNEPDPLALCERMGILVLFQPMGTYTGACKGFFLSQSRMHSILPHTEKMSSHASEKTFKKLLYPILRSILRRIVSKRPHCMHWTGCSPLSG